MIEKNRQQGICPRVNKVHLPTLPSIPVDSLCRVKVCETEKDVKLRDTIRSKIESQRSVSWSKRRASKKLYGKYTRRRTRNTQSKKDPHCPRDVSSQV